MNIIFTCNNENDSHLVNMEYIPITLIFKEKEYVKHIGFYYEDTDLCEFSVDPYTNDIVKFVLTNSNHYELFDENIYIPESKSGKIQLDCQSKIDCNYFKTLVYCDGVHIILSDMEPVSFYKMGQMILGVDTNDNISAIYIVELTSDDISFIKNELILDRK